MIIADTNNSTNKTSGKGSSNGGEHRHFEAVGAGHFLQSQRHGCLGV